jgi:hypothetical protein
VLAGGHRPRNVRACRRLARGFLARATARTQRIYSSEMRVRSRPSIVPTACAGELAMAFEGHRHPRVPTVLHGRVNGRSIRGRRRPSIGTRVPHAESAMGIGVRGRTHVHRPVPARRDTGRGASYASTIQGRRRPHVVHATGRHALPPPRARLASSRAAVARPIGVRHRTCVFPSSPRAPRAGWTEGRSPPRHARASPRGVLAFPRRVLALPRRVLASPLRGATFASRHHEPPLRGSPCPTFSRPPSAASPTAPRAHPRSPR